MSSASSVGWLWLTDLHFGQKDQRWLWPTYQEDFLDDLTRVYRLAGPWDAVIFTGDMVFSGKPEEFAGLTPVRRQVLDRITDLQDYAPALLSVPGNHDLKRAKKSATIIAFEHWCEHAEIHEEFWNDPESEYRKIIAEAHFSYSDWASSNGFKSPTDFRPGTLPGDFSAIIAKDGIRIGFVGLNSTFHSGPRFLDHLLSYT